MLIKKMKSSKQLLLINVATCGARQSNHTAGDPVDHMTLSASRSHDHSQLLHISSARAGRILNRILPPILVPLMLGFDVKSQPLHGAL